MKDQRPPFVLNDRPPVRWDDDGPPNLRELIYSLLAAGVGALLLLPLVALVLAMWGAL